MRICGVIASLGSGGAERVMTELCAGWHHRGHSVTLLTLSSGVDDFYAVPSGVQRVALGLASVSANAMEAVRANMTRLHGLRAALRAAQPDVVVSFTDQTNVLVLLAAQQLGIPVVVSERIDPRRHDPGSAWRALRHATYRHAAAIVVQTERVRSWAERFVPTGRVYVIPNPQRAAQVATPPAGERATRIMAMGRLVPQKGFDQLIRAFVAVAADFPEWRLEIYGEGPDRDTLEASVRTHGVSHVVSLPGRTTEGDAALATASIFALTSRYEGFPNVLLEAMTHGCACVATDCDSGPAELLVDRQSGLLAPVDDTTAIAGALRQLMGDRELRTALGHGAQKASARFTPECVLDQWDAVLRSVSNTMRNAA